METDAQSLESGHRAGVSVKVKTFLCLAWGSGGLRQNAHIRCHASF